MITTSERCLWIKLYNLCLALHSGKIKIVRTEVNFWQKPIIQPSALGLDSAAPCFLAAGGTAPGTTWPPLGRFENKSEKLAMNTTNWTNRIDHRWLMIGLFLWEYSKDLNGPFSDHWRFVCLLYCRRVWSKDLKAIYRKCNFEEVQSPVTRLTTSRIARGQPQLIALTVDTLASFHGALGCLAFSWLMRMRLSSFPYCPVSS